MPSRFPNINQNRNITNVEVSHDETESKSSGTSLDLNIPSNQATKGNSPPRSLNMLVNSALSCKVSFILQKVCRMNRKVEVPSNNDALSLFRFLIRKTLIIVDGALLLNLPQCSIIEPGSDAGKIFWGAPRQWRFGGKIAKGHDDFASACNTSLGGRNVQSRSFHCHISLRASINRGLV